MLAALTLALAAGALPAPVAGQPGRQRLSYPETRRVAVTDEYHGEKVGDPYRWLEELNAPATAAWIGAQNAVTARHLASLPARDSLRTRITALWNYPKVTLPWREGGRIWYRKNSGLQRQSVVFARPTVAGPATPVIDPNALSPDGSVALQEVAPSADGRFLAYSLAEGGADWQTVLVRDIASGRDRADTVRWLRFSGVSWTHDGNGFFYSRFPEPAKGKQLEAALGTHALYYHRLGTPQSADRLVFKREGLRNWVVNGSVTEDGRYVQIVFSPGSIPKNRLYYIDLGDPKRPNVAAPVRPIVEADDGGYYPVGNVGPTFYLMTDYQAPKWRVVAVDAGRPDRTAWKTVVPEAQHTLENAVLAGGHVAVQHLADARSRLTLFALDGKQLDTIALPGVGTVAGLSGRNDSPELFYTYTSPLYPATVFVHDTRRGAGAPFEAARPAFDAGAYETTQRFATSKDGTRVPYFVTARRGIALDGQNPTLLYGYGGYAISTLPTYRPDVPAWLERGGVFVTASLRGGGEYGEAWHRAGMLANKQNVFDDFIAVAEDLVRRGYTSPARLAVQGGSNGGLLVGAVLNQRPDLFAAALPAVGVMDMLRYDRFTGGGLWVVEFGAASDPALYPVLRRYSPLHNIKPGACYPATLVTTADHDDRVVPSHSFKYTAALQAAQGCDRPVLIRVETMGSHGYRPTDKRIAELADQWAFVAAHTGGRSMAVQP
jgi:prolyl oligopeptidase